MRTRRDAGRRPAHVRLPRRGRQRHGDRRAALAPPAVLAPGRAGSLPCWLPAVLAPCRAGSLPCWLPAVLAPRTALAAEVASVPGFAPACSATFASPVAGEMFRDWGGSCSHLVMVTTRMAQRPARGDEPGTRGRCPADRVQKPPGIRVVTAHDPEMGCAGHGLPKFETSRSTRYAPEPWGSPDISAKRIVPKIFGRVGCIRLRPRLIAHTDTTTPRNKKPKISQQVPGQPKLTNNCPTSVDLAPGGVCGVHTRRCAGLPAGRRATPCRSSTAATRRWLIPNRPAHSCRLSRWSR